MSLLRRDEIRVALTPEYIALARVARGWHPTVLAKQTLRFSSTEPSEWKSCIEALRQGLQEKIWQGGEVTVVLSNHFVRYALVPWSKHLVSKDEKEAWVRHQFVERYGEYKGTAEYRLSEEGRPDSVCVASAVDSEFVGKIREVFKHSSLRVRSVQPYLMAAFNRCKPHIKDASVWILLPESGRMCMAAVGNREWRNILSISIGPDWQTELTRLLERQILLADDELPAVVLVYGSGISSLDVPHSADVPLRILTPRAINGYAPESEPGYAMALTGLV